MGEGRLDIKNTKKKKITITKTRKKTETKKSRYPTEGVCYRSPDIRAVSPKRCRISMESRISKNMFAYVES